MSRTDTLDKLLERIRRNTEPLDKAYGNTGQLLNVAVSQAFPWVLGLPVVRNKIPAMLRNSIPKGSPVTLDALERLATQLVAILAAEYSSGETGPDGADDNQPDPADPVIAQGRPGAAKIHNLMEQ